MGLGSSRVQPLWCRSAHGKKGKTSNGQTPAPPRQVGLLGCSPQAPLQTLETKGCFQGINSLVLSNSHATGHVAAGHSRMNFPELANSC